MLAQSLADAAPAPATLTLPATLRRLAGLSSLADDSSEWDARRRLLQSSLGGVQVQVIVMGMPASANQVATALQDAVSSGQFQANLQQNGELTHHARHVPLKDNQLHLFLKQPQSLKHLAV